MMAADTLAVGPIASALTKLMRTLQKEMALRDSISVRSEPGSEQ